MATAVRKDDEGGKSEAPKPNRAQRRHPFAGWLRKIPKLQDPIWRAQTRKARKRRNKFIKKQRRLNVRPK